MAILACALALLALAPAAARAAPPLVSITSPAAGSVGNDRTPTMTGMAQEVHGVVTVAIHAGPTLSGAVVLEPSVVVFGPGEAWSLEVPAPLADGTYTAQARESNAAHETGSSAPVSFTIETGAPAVVLLAPESPSSNTRPAFAGTASDPFKPVTVQIHQGAGVAGTLVSLASAIGTGAAWESGPASPPLVPGEYTALATQESSIPGNPTGRSEPETFTVVAPPAPPAPLLAAPAPPTAAFRWVPAAPKTGEEVLLVSSSSDPAGAIASFAWSLSADGPFAPGASVLGTSFATPGAHPVRLRVTAQNGLSAIVAETIEVSGRPAALMTPFPVVRFAGTQSANGVRLAVLRVQQAPAGARITVRCRGRGCPFGSVSRTTVRHAHGVAPVSFPAFERYLRAGIVLEILITKAGEIGKFTRFAVRAGRLPERFDECLDAAGRRALACPS